jgi:TolA-binding protein
MANGVDRMRGIFIPLFRRVPAALAAALAFGLAAALAPPASAQQFDSRDAIALHNEILALRRDLDQLSQQVSATQSNLGARAAPPPVYTGSGAAGGGGDLAAQLLDRVSALEDQMRRLQGRVDEIDNARQRQYDDLSKQIGDLKFAMRSGGGGSGTLGSPPPDAPPPPDVSTPTAPPAAPPPPPRRTAELVLQEANAALARRDYAAAETAAREAVALPKGPRTADAMFTLGQALSAQGKYAPAAVSYGDAYQRNPGGSHAQESLLGLAISLNALNDKVASCEALEKLRAAFPTPKPELRETIASARARASCH